MNTEPARRRSVWPRGRSRPGVAIDLGSARTRVWTSDAGLVADAPTVSSFRDELNHPVRRGSIVDPEGVAWLLRHLLHGTGTLGARPGILVLTMPALCTAADRAAGLSAAEVLDPATVLTVDGVKAAAIGANADFSGPQLVVDFGAHLTEVALLCEGSVSAASCTAIGTSDLAGSVTTTTLVEVVLDMVSGLLRTDCGPQIVDALDTGPVLTGGGSLRPAIVYQLSKRLSCQVRPAPRPHTAAVRGAAQLVLAAHRHPSSSLRRT
ncbi:rod shape-determining protein [Kribbella lupini]|uniref:Rod shape-determining protein n=1 Tax=Kribbella lupini TaxID=291602 RepID=A0ABN2AKX0_9ACTN